MKKDISKTYCKQFAIYNKSKTNSAATVGLNSGMGIALLQVECTIKRLYKYVVHEPF